MPTYTYRYPNGETVDVEQSIHEPAHTHLACNVCGGSYTSWPPLTRALCRFCEKGLMPVRKVFHSPGVVLKGRGFYRTGG